ncbi:hypothetical protein [Rhizobium sp. AG207R]|uniref:hypothetical protein n=1 Tax=Rhizobium sp. AG207R TaxID=2802287 RepID=UPI0022ABDD53|nr:hypothetical protein [Rhizobium sp. AG207R]MCZ3377482.1 hypothetical protein [Rhizobium sp. AG207R]
MSKIPDEIIQAGILEAEIYAKWLHAGNSKGSLSPHAIDGLADSFSRLILSERHRHAEVMEEVRKVLEPFAAECATWPDDKAPDDYVIKIKLYSKVMSSKLRVGDLRVARALLSKLEGQ